MEPNAIARSMGLLILAGLMTPSSGGAAEPVKLAALLARAQERNPSIHAARQAYQAAQASIAAARTWPDPVFGFADERVPSGQAGVAPMRMRRYRVQQMIPFPGKLSAEGRMKYHEALIVRMRYRDQVLDVFRDVSLRYYQLYLTDQTIDLAAQSVELMKNVLRAAQARLGSGQSSAVDVFMAQTELRKMENMLFEQQQERKLIAIELNELLNQATETPWGAVEAPEVREIPVSLEELQTLARENSPALRTAAYEIDHSRAMAGRSRLSWAPDFGLMAERITADEGPAGREIGVTLTLPLWFRRPWSENRAAREHIEEADAGAEAVRNRVRQRVHQKYVETQTRIHLIQSYKEGLLPSARSTLHATREQYASGRGDFVRFLEAFRSWIAAHTDYQRQIYHYGEHWSSLERWTGVRLTLARQALEQREWGLEDENGH